MENDHRPFPHAAQLLERRRGESADVTTARAGECRMSVGTARRIRWQESGQPNASTPRVTPSGRALRDVHRVVDTTGWKGWVTRKVCGPPLVGGAIDGSRQRPRG